jgi:uncharacterized protein
MSFMNPQSPRTDKLRKDLEKLYGNYQKELLFHGWHHIIFVARKSVEFASELQADKEIVEAAALTHDLNYIVDVRTESPEAGLTLRISHLKDAGFSDEEIEKINSVVQEEHIGYRGPSISDEAKALADADCLFKVMPLTPVLFSSKFITETKVDLRYWAERIIKEQKPLLDQGIYFYTDSAKQKYPDWAKTDLQLVQQVLDSLDDPAIQEMLSIAYKLEVI